jgi:Zn-dependent M28 family amino/carboxypeptidase
MRMNGYSRYFMLPGILLLIFSAVICFAKEVEMVDLKITEQNLKEHMEMLTRTIGERSAGKLWNLEKAAGYIESFYKKIQVDSKREAYPFKKETVHNIVADVGPDTVTPEVYIIGAHYDSVAGTVGADDNGSAVAVQLEVARQLAELKETELGCRVRFISFALEEPPAYATWAMGSRVYAKKARKTKEQIDGMICLEMVGYTCNEPGCQSYPFPLMFFDYPKTGDYIGIVGNFRSRKFTRELYESFQAGGYLPVESVVVPGNGYLIPNIRLSDHASFWDKGYKAVMITDTAFYRNPNYHTPRDTMDKLDFSFMARLVESLVHFFVQKVPG